METRDYLLFGFTAVIGLLSGAYIYFSVFVPVYVDERPAAASEQFSIVGAEYGDCTTEGCPSFQLTQNQRYEYFNPALGEKALTGKYPQAKFNELVQTLTRGRIVVAAASNTASACEESEYNFAVTLVGETYSLDTCTTNLRTDRELRILLAEIFTVLDEPEAFEYTIDNLGEVGIFNVLFE